MEFTHLGIYIWVRFQMRDRFVNAQMSKITMNGLTIWIHSSIMLLNLRNKGHHSSPLEIMRKTSINLTMLWTAAQKTLLNLKRDYGSHTWKTKLIFPYRTLSHKTDITIVHLSKNWEKWVWTWPYLDIFLKDPSENTKRCISKILVPLAQISMNPSYNWEQKSISCSILECIPMPCT